MVKKRDQGTIDNFFSGYNEQAVDEAFNHYDKHVDPTVVSGVNTKVVDGMTDFYNAFKASLESDFGSDLHVDFKKNKEKIKAAKLKGLKAFFKKVDPDMLSHQTEHAENDDKLYDSLIVQYDKHTLGFDPQNDSDSEVMGLDYMMKKGENIKDYTVEQFRNDVYGQTNAHANQITNVLVSGKAMEKFKGLKPQDIARYVHTKAVAKKGHKVDMARFYQHDVMKSIGIRNHFEKGKELKGSYKENNIVMKEEDKKQ